MITLDYQLDSTAAAQAKGVDMASADAASLRYLLFPGDISFRGDGVDFSTAWGWVQVLDFALSLAAIMETLKRQGVAHLNLLNQMPH
jgi:hypothetical protein